MATVNLEDNHVGRLVSAVRKTLEEKRSLTMAKVVASKGEEDNCHGRRGAVSDSELSELKLALEH